jgi:type IV secretion system protein VirD4
MGWKDSQGNPTKTHPVIGRAMRSLLDKSDNERSGVISEIKGFLELYRDPVIATNTAISDFRIEDLMNHRRPVSLYVVVPLAHKDSLRPLIRLMLSQILHRLTERLEYREGRAITGYRHRLLLMIDEFASLGRLDMFADSLALIAGYGIKACLIAQDLSQIHAAYGYDEAITSNCHTRTAFTPNRIETARLLSQMAGEATVRHAHRTFSSTGASLSEPEVARPLVTPDEVTRLGSNEALIFTSGQPAIRATKIRYYTEPFFKQRAAIQPPSKTDRIANSSANEKAASVMTPPPTSHQVTPDTEGYQPQRESSFLVKAAGPPPNRQLTFLKFAGDHGDSTSVVTNRGRKKERLL